VQELEYKISLYDLQAKSMIKAFEQEKMMDKNDN